MANHFFRWNGQHLGFENNGNLFSPNSEYMGWIERDGSVWGNSGQYIGEVIEGQYILRNANKIPPIPKIPKIPPIPPISPIPPIAKTGRIPKAGWVDPFDE